MLDRSEILNILNEVEDRFPVDQWIVGGLHVWPLVRVVLTNILLDAYHGIGIQQEARYERLTGLVRRVVRTYGGYLKAIIEDRRKNASTSLPVKVVFLGDGASFVKQDGFYYDRFCEPLIDFLESRSIDSLFLTYGNYYYHPRHNPSKWIQPYMDWIRLRARGTRKATPQGTTDLPQFQDFFKWIQPEFPFVTQDRFPLAWSVFLIQQTCDYFLSLFRRVRPVFAVTAQYYGLENFAFNLACRRFNIPSMEIQHGLQGRANPFYVGWHRHPQEGYEVFPDYFWVWSEYERQCIMDWTSRFVNCPKPVIGYNYYLEIWKEGQQEITHMFRSKIEKVKNSFFGKKHILVTLQGPKQMDSGHQMLLRYALEKTWDSHVWWFRLHPTFIDKKRYFKNCFSGFDNTVDISVATELPLYSLLPHMDLHMTYNSSSVLEAEQFGVASIVYSIDGRDSYPEQIESGMALHVSTPEALLDGIWEQGARRVPVSELKLKSEERLNASRKVLLDLIEKGF
ncbi:MAG: hypothetical protein KC553_01480 [Nitrospina sp.]|nr:hypothetical protein [Nitrospina sp.]